MLALPVSDPRYQSKSPSIQSHSNVSIYHQYYNKLEIWGRAQFDATRHRKSDWKYNLVGCKVCKNLRQQHPLQPKYTSCKSPFGWVYIYALNLFVSGPKYTNFCRPIFTIKIRIWAISSQILHILAPEFLMGQPPNFWTWIIKCTQISIT